MRIVLNNHGVLKAGFGDAERKPSTASKKLNAAH
jgi:hypothetical protein